MILMVDTLADDRSFPTLNIVDDFTRECVAIEVGPTTERHQGGC